MAWVSATIRMRSPALGLESARGAACCSFRGEELGGRAGQGVGLDLEPDQAFGADAGDGFGESVQVLAAIAPAAAGHADSADAVAGFAAHAGIP